jgi:ATP-dependent Lhr-like helicase
LATEIQLEDKPRVRILAVYPRRELLKDQFHETWEQARKLDKQLLSAGSRKIRIGALFGETQHSAQYTLKDGQEFTHFRLLKCVDAECRGEMRWSRADIHENKERLVCHLCGHKVSSDEVALTRESVADNPPDILFTTTEMLNQKMPDSRFRHLFGISVSKSLPLVLLDEVHTYSGSQGAQTALLLRRWMRLSGNRPHFVGLSATLRDAENFFATLTGANKSRVNLIEPQAEEMIEKGAEYLLALRGDPVSQTALLSTTIQATMLSRRVLDHTVERKSRGVWGSKTFVFTDDLPWFDDYTLTVVTFNWIQHCWFVFNIICHCFFE